MKIKNWDAVSFDLEKVVKLMLNAKSLDCLTELGVLKLPKAAKCV